MLEKYLNEIQKDNSQVDFIKNGVGRHKDNSDNEYNSDELKKGIKIEMEHTDNKEISKEIAKDHLAEISDYYTRLIKMEQEAKK